MHCEVTKYFNRANERAKRKGKIVQIGIKLGTIQIQPCTHHGRCNLFRTGTSYRIESAALCLTHFSLAIIITNICILYKNANANMQSIILINSASNHIRPRLELRLERERKEREKQKNAKILLFRAMRHRLA